MTIPSWVTSYLDVRHVPHVLRHHSPVYSGQALAKIEHYSGDHVAKVVVSIADGRPSLLVLPASRSVDFKKARKVLQNRHLRLAREDEIRYFFPDCEVGAIPPLNRWKNVPVYVDQELLMSGGMMFQAGTYEDAVLVASDDWFRMVKPQVANFATSFKKHRQSTGFRNAVLKGLGTSIAVVGLAALGLYLVWRFLDGWAMSAGIPMSSGG